MAQQAQQQPQPPQPRWIPRPRPLPRPPLVIYLTDSDSSEEEIEEPVVPPVLNPGVPVFIDQVLERPPLEIVLNPFREDSDIDSDSDREVIPQFYDYYTQKTGDDTEPEEPKWRLPGYNFKRQRLNDSRGENTTEH